MESLGKMLRLERWLHFQREGTRVFTAIRQKIIVMWTHKTAALGCVIRLKCSQYSLCNFIISFFIINS